jgi:hypothetical protein
VGSFLRKPLTDFVTSSFGHELQSHLIFESCHIAILFSDEYGENHISRIKKQLTRKEFPCGDFVEQINNRDLIAVGLSKRALSLDWPVVIYVKSSSQKNELQDLLPLSRCISKLIIVADAFKCSRSRLQR